MVKQASDVGALCGQWALEACGLPRGVRGLKGICREMRLGRVVEPQPLTAPLPPKLQMSSPGEPVRGRGLLGKGLGVQNNNAPGKTENMFAQTYTQVFMTTLSVMAKGH